MNDKRCGVSGGDPEGGVIECHLGIINDHTQTRTEGKTVYTVFTFTTSD